MHEGALDLCSALFIHNIQCKKQSTERLHFSNSQWRSQDIAVARAQHEHTTFVRTFARSAEVYRGVWGHPPPKNLGILQTPRSVLRPYTVGVAKCKSLTPNSRMRLVIR